MKFLCVSCDEPMKLTRTAGPDQGSITVVFACPGCGWETAMMTNQMETQMVRSLGVKIGGQTVPSGPMEMLRSSLADGHALSDAPSSLDATARAAQHGDDATTPETAESKCPFSGVIAEAFAKRESSTIVWTKEAEERLARIPSFAQGMARKGVEMHAIEQGYTEITDAVMDEVKGRFGM